MNFSTSTQYKYWRFSREELCDLRQSTRNTFLNNRQKLYDASAKSLMQTEKQTTFTTQAEIRNGVSKPTTVQLTHKRKLSDLDGGIENPVTKKKKKKKKKKSKTLSDLSLSIEEEQQYIGSWILQVNQLMEDPDRFAKMNVTRKKLKPTI